MTAALGGRPLPPAQSMACCLPFCGADFSNFSFSSLTRRRREPLESGSRSLGRSLSCCWEVLGLPGARPAAAFTPAQDMLVVLAKLAQRDVAEGRPVESKDPYLGGRPVDVYPWHREYEDCLDEAQVTLGIARALLRCYRKNGQYVD